MTRIARMLLTCALLASGGLAAPGIAQPPPAGTRLPGVPATVGPRRTIHFGDLAREEARRPPWTGPVVGWEPPQHQRYVEPDVQPERLIQLEAPPAFEEVAGPSPARTLAGLDDAPIIGTGSLRVPPDTDGAVGPTRLFEGLNNNYEIKDKATGATLGAVGIQTFWGATGFGGSAFDPRALYDPYNDRWIVCAVAAPQTTSSAILVGISQTGDPSGGWYLFAVDADAGANWADFPTLGFNKNWVAINVNMFANAGGAPAGSKCLVIDYPALRSGTFTATLVTGTGFTSAPCATYSTTEDTLYVPTHQASANGTYTLDRITGTPDSPIYTVTNVSLSRGLTWTAPGGQILPQAAPLAGASNCSPPCKIESQDAQIRSTPVYRDGSIWYTQTVGIPSGGLTHTGVQWTRIDAATGAVQDGGRIEDPTANATNGGKWYAYPHVAVNACGDVVIGYTQFSSAQHAAAGYSFRLGTDPPGALREPVIYKAGEDYYRKDFGSGRNRWGDYSKAQVDPSDDTSFWLIQEYAKPRAGTDDGITSFNSSRWGTWWAKVAPVATIGAAPSLTEGDEGATALDFTVDLSLPACSPITVNYSVTDGTATAADGDYQTTGSSIVIPSGATSGVITVNVVGDGKREADETFTVTLTSLSLGELGATVAATGVILNDDPEPTISIADGSANEGNEGTSVLSLAATLSNPTDQTVTVTFALEDDTATLADDDYGAGGGTLTFPPGTTGPQPADVTVNGDTDIEPDEALRVVLSDPANATILDDLAAATILNDDVDATLPVATVVAPNAEEWHYLGEPLDLLWSATDDVGVTSVDLRLSRDGGANYEDIALGESNDGLYTWTVTSPFTNQALFQVIARDAAGNTGSDVSDEAWHIADVVAAPLEAAVTEMSLGPIRPNPSRGSVSIGYALPRAAEVRIDVLDVQGRLVATLASGEKPSGRHRVSWAAPAGRSGLFFARARLGGKVFRQRFVVTR